MTDSTPLPVRTPRHRLAQILNTFPFSGDANTRAARYALTGDPWGKPEVRLDGDELLDVLADVFDALRVRVRNYGIAAENDRAELRQLKNDVAAMRRVLGTEEG